MSAEKQPKIRPFQAWLLATRPKTLPAAAAAVIVGSAIAFADGAFRLLPALAALLGALLLQIGSNVANDLYDFQRGTDAGERLGPLRVTQAGLLSVAQVQRGMWLIFGLATLIGVYLTSQAGWVVIAIGLTAILSAIAYTGGPFPYGYHGLGDLFVFIFFGLAATAGTYYVQAHTTSPLVWWLAAAMGLLIVAILVVNNLRDYNSDRAARKRTLVVLWGPKFARIEYLVCLVGAFAIPVVVWRLGLAPPTGLLTWLTMPLAIKWSRRVYTWEGRALNKILAGTGQLALFYGLLFSLGIVLPTVF